MHKEWCNIKLREDPGRIRRGAPDPQVSKEKSRAILSGEGVVLPVRPRSRSTLSC